MTFAVVGDGGGGGGFGQQLKLPPGRHESRRLDDGKSLVSSHGVLDAGRRRRILEIKGFFFLKTVKSKRSGERDRSVMYNIIYTLQLGLHLESRTSPKEVTSLYKGQVIQSRDKEVGVL